MSAITTTPKFMQSLCALAKENRMSKKSVAAKKAAKALRVKELERNRKVAENMNKELTKLENAAKKEAAKQSKIDAKNAKIAAKEEAKNAKIAAKEAAKQSKIDAKEAAKNAKIEAKDCCQAVQD